MQSSWIYSQPRSSTLQEFDISSWPTTLARSHRLLFKQNSWHTKTHLDGGSWQCQNKSATLFKKKWVAKNTCFGKKIMLCFIITPTIQSVFSILIINIVLMLLQAVLLSTTCLFTQRWTHLTPKLQSEGTLFFKELGVHYLTWIKTISCATVNFIFGIEMRKSLQVYQGRSVHLFSF